MIPRFKPVTYTHAAGHVVFQPDVGVELRIDDPRGQVSHLVGLLDGTHTVAQVHTGMQSRWPELTVEDVREGIDGLGEAGLVENAAVISPLTPLRQDRYTGNLSFFGHFATLRHDRFQRQQRLLDAHVLLLGVGGVGCSLLLHLAGLGVGRLTIVDYDAIELKNLTRQFLYREDEVGAEKITRAAEFVRSFNSDVAITPVSRRITSTDEVASLLDGVDVVLSAIDEPPIEIDRWVNDACVAARVPFVMGGLRVSRALYFSVQPGVSGCLRCLHAVSPSDAPGPALDHRSAPSVAPAVGLIAGLMGMEALRYLTGFAPPVAAGRVWLADLENGAVGVAYEWARQDACEVCALPPRF